VILAVLVAVVLISGGIAVHKYLREHPPPDLGSALAKIYRADHPKALARAQADKRAIAKGETVPDGVMVALGHLLFGTGRALRYLGRKIRERVEAGREVPPLEIVNADAAAPAGGGPAAPDTPPAEAEAEAEQDTPPPDTTATAPQEETAPMTTTTLAALYEASEDAAAQNFEGVVAVERFLKAVATGCESVTHVWVRWAERLGGPLHVDDSVVDHIRACAPHQATIAGLTGEASSHVTVLLDGSITEALERGQDVPHHHLMNSAGGYPAIPAFYERFGTYITQKREDIRGELLLMVAVKDASAKQAEMFRSAARRMADAKDINVKRAAEKYLAAARVQDAITERVEAAHVQFAVIIRMSIRALADSSMKAPNAQLHGVG
jgi:hypothetical protein